MAYLVCCLCAADDTNGREKRFFLNALSVSENLSVVYISADVFLALLVETKMLLLQPLRRAALVLAVVAIIVVAIDSNVGCNRTTRSVAFNSVNTLAVERIIIINDNSL